MKRIRARTWEDLDQVPEGEWVHVVGGLDVEVLDATTRSEKARIVIPLPPDTAKSLRLRKGEVLEANLNGRKLEVVRRGVRRKQPRS